MLTTTEEQLVRQLLEEQAALLSLASSESEILSNLGGDQATLSDLAAATVLADADLMLVRQGTTDKSVNGQTLKSFAIGDAAKNVFTKSNGLNVAWQKTGAQTLATATNLVVSVNGALKSISANTPITMPSLSSGNDYSIWAAADGSLVAVLDSYSSPASAPSANAVKVGGFHYGLVAPGTTVDGGSFNTAGSVTTGGMVWTQSQVDDIAGINKYSLWDLKFRCNGEQRGMAYDPWVNAWAGIYFVSSNHITNGPSRFNSDVASGTVLPRIPLTYGGNGSTNYTNGNWWTFNEIAASFGLRLPREREFVSAAFGVTENQSLGGASSTIPATNRQAGYTSRIGLEQATGHHWTWGEDSSTRWDGTGGFAWRNLNGGRGQIYIGGDVNLVRVLLGGTRGDAAFSGSRASNWADFPWLSVWYFGGRLFGDHVCLL